MDPVGSGEWLRLVTAIELQIMQSFPGLTIGGFYQNSPATLDYNCIAWALNDTQNHWWPSPWPGRQSVWPAGVPKQLTLSAFRAMFASAGFQACADGTLEPGFDKIAIYGKSNGQ